MDFIDEAFGHVLRCFRILTDRIERLEKDSHPPALHDICPVCRSVVAPGEGNLELHAAVMHYERS